MLAIKAIKAMSFINIHDTAYDYSAFLILVADHLHIVFYLSFLLTIIMQLRGSKISTDHSFCYRFEAALAKKYAYLRAPRRECAMKCDHQEKSIAIHYSKFNLRFCGRHLIFLGSLR